MRVLGIDPGSRKTGFGLVEFHGKKVTYLDSGVMIFENEKVFINRLGDIYKSCINLIEETRPDYISIESLIYVKNVSSLAKLAQARGAMIAAFLETHKNKIFEYSPNLIKNAVTGHGHATKESVDKSLSLFFGQKLNYKTHDESDALAIAIGHYFLAGQNISGNTQPISHSKGGRSLKDVFSHLE